MWTKESLHQLVEEKLRDYLFIVVSNREPLAFYFQSDDMQKGDPPLAGRPHG